MARRDRHGRGPRGPLVVGILPPSRTRRGAFESLVIDAAVRLQERWGAECGVIAVSAVDFPPEPTPDSDDIPAGANVPARGGEPARVVVYRRPVEDRSSDANALAATVRDVLAEQFSELLGRPPEDIDPDYGT